MCRLAATVAAAAAAGAVLFAGCSSTDDTRWSPAQLSVLRSLSLSSLEPAADPSNRYAADPAAAALGRSLFFDERLSANGRVSCSSCHMPSRDFQDGRRVAKGIRLTTRRTMSIVGAAHQTWLFWDGRKDSLWSQALGPLENPLEHGMTRSRVVATVKRIYKRRYEAVFGQLAGQSVDRAFANVGKAVAAYEMKIRLEPARFDRYVRATLAKDGDGMRSAMSAQEVDGLKLFIGKARCIDCHSGPLFTNGEFHNTGVPQTVRDVGRLAGIAQLRDDEFNCVGRYSDANPAECAMQFLPRGSERLRGAFKPPSLRNVARRAPYMHAGEFRTLAQVLRHYNRAPRAAVGHSELHPLHLADRQIEALAAFLKTLESETRSP